MTAPVRVVTAPLAFLLFAFAGASPVEAQIWEKAKEVVTDVTERIECVVTDRECIDEAQSQGREVVVTDASGQPISEANPSGNVLSADDELGDAVTSDPVGPWPGVHGRLSTKALRQAGVYISPDNRHVALEGLRGSRAVMQIDGQPDPVFDRLGFDRLGRTLFTFSRTGGHYAYVAERGGESYVVIDGTENLLSPHSISTELDRTAVPPHTAFYFDEGGENLAYIVESRGRSSPGGAFQRVAVNGALGPRYSWRGVSPPVVKGGRVAYIATAIDAKSSSGRRGSGSGAATRTDVVIDGTARTYAGAKHLHITPDGKHVVYAALQDGKWHAVIDGAPSEPYQAIAGFVQHPTGRVAYIAQVGVREVEGAGFGVKKRAVYALVVDETEYRSTDVGEFLAVGISSGPYIARPSFLQFSPDGERLVFVTSRDGGQVVWIDGEPGRPYEKIKEIFISPDGERVAYIAEANRNDFVVLGDEELGPYISNQIEGFQFSDNGASYAFSARPSGGGQRFVVVNGERAAIPGRSVQLSPDGSQYAYVGEVGRERTVVLNGTPLDAEPRDFERLLPAAPDVPPVFFGPDGRLAFIQRTGRTSYALRVGEEAWDVGHGAVPVFVWSPDGQHFVSAAYSLDPKAGGRPATLIVNGKPGPSFDELVSTWTVTEDNVLQFVAVRDGTVHRVQVALEDR